MSAAHAGKSWFSPGRPIVATVGTLLGVSLIAVMLYVMHRAAAPPPVVPELMDGKTRSEVLAEVRQSQQQAATTYGWVDRNRGVVRIPLSEAMELVLAERGTPAGRGTDAPKEPSP